MQCIRHHKPRNESIINYLRYHRERHQQRQRSTHTDYIIILSVILQNRVYAIIGGFKPHRRIYKAPEYISILLCIAFLNMCAYFFTSWYSDRKQIYITYLRQYHTQRTESDRESQRAGTSTDRINIYCLSVPALKVRTGSTARNFSGADTAPTNSRHYSSRFIFSVYSREFSGLILQPGILIFCFRSSNPVYVFGLNPD